MAIISKIMTVVDLPKDFIKRLLAWLIWLFIYLIPLLGYGKSAQAYVLAG